MTVKGSPFQDLTQDRHLRGKWGDARASQRTGSRGQEAGMGEAKGIGSAVQGAGAVRGQQC